jgi:hypothetical protein
LIAVAELVALSKLVGSASKLVVPPALGIVTQCGQGCLVDIVALGPEKIERAPGHSLIRSHVGDVFLCVRRRGADGIDDPFRLAIGVEMYQPMP